jgi:hypothetical protein
MVWGSRRIEPNRVTPQGFEEQGVSDATKGDHIDGAAEDLCEVLAKTHVAAEEVRRVVWKVHKHIDVAAAWVEVIARSRADQFRNDTPRRSQAARMRSRLSETRPTMRRVYRASPRIETVSLAIGAAKVASNGHV